MGNARCGSSTRRRRCVTTLTSVLADFLPTALGAEWPVGRLLSSWHARPPGRSPVVNFRKRRLAKNGKIPEQRRGEDDRVRVFNRRFATATRRLGHARTAVRLAGVYALAGLADDWQDGRQTCIDELCAYLRMPYEPPPEVGPPAAEQ